MEPAASMHTVTPAPAAQAAPAVPAIPAAPAAQVAPAAPAAPVAPAVPVASQSSIEMIRLKDRIALLEERIEKLRKVITDLI